MLYYYTRDQSGYYIYIDREIRYIGEKIAIGFTTHPSYRKALLHKHGSVYDVEKWFNRAVAKIIQAGAPLLAEDVKVLIFSDIDPEEVNKMVHRQEYLGEWLERSDVKL